MLAKGLVMSGDAREAFLPLSVSRELRIGRGLQAGALRASHKEGPRLRRTSSQYFSARSQAPVRMAGTSDKFPVLLSTSMQAQKKPKKEVKAKVVKQAPRELLAPMYRVGSVLSKIRREVEREGPSPASLQAVQTFAKGSGFFSDKGLLRSISSSYVKEIEYDDVNGTEYGIVVADRLKRLEAVDIVIGSLEKAADLPKESTRAEFMYLLNVACNGVDCFLRLAPSEDVKAYDELVELVRRYDTNLDGRLTGDELSELTEEQRQFYVIVAGILPVYS